MAGIIRDYVWVLGFYAIILVCTYILHHKLKHRSPASKKVPFLSITIAILLLEAARQVIALARGYTPANLPFYMCSLYMLIFALASFAKTGSKLSNIGYALSLIIGMPLAISTLLLPFVVFDVLIYGSATQHIFTGNAVFRHYHSFFFHMLGVFFVTLCVVFRPYKPVKRDGMLAIIVFLCFVLTSTIASKLTQVNYIRIWGFPLNIPVPVLVILYQIIPLMGFVLSRMLFAFTTKAKQSDL